MHHDEYTDRNLWLHHRVLVSELRWWPTSLA